MLRVQALHHVAEADIHAARDPGDQMDDTEVGEGIARLGDDGRLEVRGGEAGDGAEIEHGARLAQGSAAAVRAPADR